MGRVTCQIKSAFDCYGVRGFLLPPCRFKLVFSKFWSLPNQDCNVSLVNPKHFGTGLLDRYHCRLGVWYNRLEIPRFLLKTVSCEIALRFVLLRPSPINLIVVGRSFLILRCIAMGFRQVDLDIGLADQWETGYIDLKTPAQNREHSSRAWCQPYPHAALYPHTVTRGMRRLGRNERLLASSSGLWTVWCSVSPQFYKYHLKWWLVSNWKPVVPKRWMYFAAMGDWRGWSNKIKRKMEKINPTKWFFFHIFYSGTGQKDSKNRQCVFVSFSPHDYPAKDSKIQKIDLQECEIGQTESWDPFSWCWSVGVWDTCRGSKRNPQI